MNTTHPIHIFIVEDNKVFNLALKSEIETSFAKTPLVIHSFDTGEDCMEKFKKIKPQVVILDYNLNSNFPKAMDGIKVLDWIKEQNKETNVIMLTGEDNIDIALRSLKHGACDYVVKTETKFKKINFSLANLFKVMDAKVETRKFKRLVFGILLCLGIFAVGSAITMVIVPGIFR